MRHCQVLPVDRAIPGNINININIEYKYKCNKKGKGENETLPGIAC